MGKSKAITDRNLTGLTIEDINEKQGGAAQGRNDYFSLKIGEETYNITYSVTFDKNLDEKDATVNTLRLSDQATRFYAGSKMFEFN